ncbi:MAG: sensor histidine kinase [Acidobacteriota bacterium]
MSLISVPYAAACTLIVVALMTTVQHRPRSSRAWSVVAAVIQSAVIPAAELVRTEALHPVVQASASTLMLLALLFPAPVWMNRPAAASESGATRRAYAALASVLAFGGIILCFDPFLNPHQTVIRVQFVPFRTEAYAVITLLIMLFMIGYAVMMMRPLRRSRSRAERRRLGIIAWSPMALTAAVLASGLLVRDPLSYAVSLSVFSCAAAFALIAAAAERPLPVSLSALPTEITYALSSAVIFALAFALIDIAGSALGTAFGIRELVGKAVLVVVIGLVFWPLVLRVQKMVRHVFYSDVEKIRSLFMEFMDQARSMTSIESIAEAFCSCLEDAFNVSRSELFLLDEAGTSYRCVQMHEREFHSTGALPELFAASSSPRAAADCIALCTEEERRVLREYEKGTVVPILFGKRIRGFLFAGPHLSGRIFHRRASFGDAFTPAVRALAFIVDRQNLIERLRRDELRFAQEDRLAVLGTFGAGIAHELRNPLNVISTSAQTILRRPDDNDMHAEVAQFIAEESRRMSRTIDEFLRFSKSNVPEWKNDDIHNIIDNALRSVQMKIEAMRILVCINIPPGFTRVVTSVRHLEHALGNIMLNAVEAMDDGGALTITVRDETRPGRDLPERMSIEIRDTGRGIPEELLEKIFDPFFTTKSEGTGLGLPIVRMILHTIGASVSASSTDRGAAFTISLPVDGRSRYD